MRRNVIAVLTIAASFLAFSRLTSKKAGRAINNGVANELISMEKKTWELWKAGDKCSFAALLADGFVNVDAQGFSNKSENIEEFDNFSNQEYRLSDFNVRWNRADVAMILYKAYLKGKYKGEPFEENLYVSSEWVRLGGKWLNVFYHETAAQNTPK